MSFPKRPDYSANKIRKAGKVLVNKDISAAKYNNALVVVNSWRVAHAYPINTFKLYLKIQVKNNVEINVKDSKNSIVVQRLKRLPTIIDKLKRQPNMSLVTMQDIGGLRAIVGKISEVQKIRDHYINSKNITHELVKIKDYIVNPKESGYRGVHLIYKYNNTKSRNPLAATYKGMLIEIQLRTYLEHYWATAVEIASIFQKEDYKSGIGKHEWLEFFSLISAVFAFVEKCKTLPQYSDFNIVQTINKLKKLENKYNFLDQLAAYSFAVKIISNDSPGYYTLIILNYVEKTVETKAYARDKLKEAAIDLAKIEKNSSKNVGIDAVLVSAGKLDTLKDAYPNYFLFIEQFTKKVDIIVNDEDIL